MDILLFYFAVALNFVLVGSVAAFGFGLIGLVLPIEGKIRAVMFRIFGWGCAGFAFVFGTGYIIGLVNGAINPSVLVIITLVFALGAFYSFNKANKHENSEKT